MADEEIKELLKKYREDNCSEAEKALLEKWYLQYNAQEEAIPQKRIEAIGREIRRELPGNGNNLRKMGPWLAAAAVTIGILIAVTLKLYHKTIPAKPLPLAHDIAPGANKAILTLANGTRINLNEAANGQLNNHQGTGILKTADGRLIYKAPAADQSNANLKPDNVTIPRGGQWQVDLSDGTKVWLNSASSLTYPASFAQQKQRLVQLSGEAYFEVAKDSKHPFIVKTPRQEVEVMGTHFNISSYEDEPAAVTTLLEGRVKVTATLSHTPRLLHPGQQSVLTINNLAVSEANTEEAVAWKNGYFRFNDENIQSIMRQLSRWYDIDVTYRDDISNARLNGKISRYKNISQVLKALQATKTVHFKVEGRRVTVMN